MSSISSVNVSFFSPQKMHILQNNMDQKKANIIDRWSHTLGFTRTLTCSMPTFITFYMRITDSQLEAPVSFFSLAKHNLSNVIWSDVERFLRFMILSKITMNGYYHIFDTQYYRDTLRARTSLNNNNNNNNIYFF